MKTIRAVILPRNRWYEHQQIKPLSKAVRVDQSSEFVGEFADSLLRFLNSTSQKVFGSVQTDSGSIGYLVYAERETELRQHIAGIPHTVKSSLTMVLDHGKEAFYFNSSNGRELLEQTLPASLEVFRYSNRKLRPAMFGLHGILNSTIETKPMPYMD